MSHGPCRKSSSPVDLDILDHTSWSLFFLRANTFPSSLTTATMPTPRPSSDVRKSQPQSSGGSHLLPYSYRPYSELVLSPNAPQPIFHQCDLRDAAAIEGVFAQYDNDGGIWAAIHLAALKAVGESGEEPLSYYRVNVAGSISLLEVSHSIISMIRWPDPLRSWPNTTVTTLSSLPVPPSTVPLLPSPFPRPPRSSQNHAMVVQREWSRTSFKMLVEPMCRGRETKAFELSASGTSSECQAP